MRDVKCIGVSGAGILKVFGVCPEYTEWYIQA